MRRATRIAPSALLGGLVLVLALFVAASWLVGFTPPLISVPGATMVFASAVCLALLGLGLCAELALPASVQSRAQTLLGVLTALMGLLVIAEHASGTALSLDWPDLHRWAMPEQSDPGRMSLPSALTFVVAGATLVLMNRAEGLWRGIAVQALTALVVAMGLIGIIGWLLRLNLAYDNALFGRMALLTAAGFVAVGAGLWLDWRRREWYRLRGLIADEGLRITLNAVVLLAIMLAVALFGGFGIVVHEIDHRATAHLREPLMRRVEQFRARIEGRLAQAALLAVHPAHVAALRALNGSATDAKVLASLETAAEALLPAGFAAIAFEGTGGRILADAGRFVKTPAPELPLANRNAALVWNDGVMLRARHALMNGNSPLGSVVTEQTLHSLTRALEYPFDFARMGSVTVCGRPAEAPRCLPQADGTSAPPASARRAAAHALRGDTGTLIARDPGDGQVVAAYSPVGDLGLALVVRLNASELYAPVREQLGVMLGLLAALVTLGSLLLYWRIAPLARRLYLHEKRLKLALDSSRSAVWDADLKAETVFLSEQWPALLGGKPQASTVPFSELFRSVHPDDAPQAWRRLRATLKSDDAPYDVEHRVRNHVGDWTWIHSVGQVVERDARGRAVRMIGINTNIAKRKQEQSFIERRASRDEATGLPNRSVFTDRLQMAMARSRRAPPDRSLMAVLFVHLEEFEEIEASQGSDAGRSLLKEVSLRFRECIRATDSMARIGVHEFAIVLEELGLTDQAAGIAEKLIASLATPVTIRRTPTQIHVNIGVSFYDGVIEVNAEELVARAQNAMFDAQTEGSNAFRLAL